MSYVDDDISIVVVAPLIEYVVDLPRRLLFTLVLSDAATDAQLAKSLPQPPVFIMHFLNSVVH